MCRSKEVRIAKSRIDDLFEMVPTDMPEYFELSSHWARYIVVRISGLMEEALESILGSYIDDKASPKVAKYAKKQISEGRRNPNTKKIESILRGFHSDWADGFVAFALEEGRKEALDSVINIRHHIAHGRDYGVTISNAKNYYEKCLELISYLEQITDLSQIA